MRLYVGARNRGSIGLQYCSAVIRGLTTLLHALQDCDTEAVLHERARDALWWDRRCRADLECPSLLELRINGIPLSGHGLAETVLALRYLEITRRLSVDPTRVLEAPPPAVEAWLRD
jgi:hypothetical protein